MSALMQLLYLLIVESAFAIDTPFGVEWYEFVYPVTIWTSPFFKFVVCV